MGEESTILLVASIPPLTPTLASIDTYLLRWASGPERLSNYREHHAMVVSAPQVETKSDASFPKVSTSSNESFDPHTTKWSDINLFKFGALITVSSTVENAIFYP